MARRVPQAVVDEILQRTSLVQLVGERVQLKKAGKDWKGLCPFHGEKTPSFTVSEEKGFYYCFGCKAGGTAFDFLMELDKLPFPEALRYLAGRAGIEIETQYFAEEAARVEKGEPLYTLLERTNEFFRRLLREDPGAEAARAYAARRGLAGEAAEAFGIGWAPSGWQRLRDKLRSAGVEAREALDAGILLKREEAGPLSWENLRDKFVDRLTFPIHDSRGRIVGFGGRALLDEQQPKYLNSPTTALFHKGKLLYNFHRARKAVAEKQAAVVVEGYMDTIALWRAGIENVVAPLGTALTADHARLIQRQTGEGGKAVLLFDADSAGRRAAFASLETVLAEGLDPWCVFLDGGKDPDEVLANGGKEALEAQIAKPRPLLAEFLRHLLEAHPVHEVAGKLAALAEAAPVLQAIRNGVQREEALRGLALGLSLSEDALRAELRRMARRPLRGPAEKPAAQEAPRPVSFPAAERTLLSIYLQSAKARQELEEQNVLELLSSAPLQHLYSAAREAAPALAGERGLALLLDRLGEDPLAAEALRAILAEPLGVPLDDEKALGEALGDTLQKLRRGRLQLQRERLRAELQEGPGSASQEDRPGLLRRLLDLERRLRQ